MTTTATLFGPDDEPGPYYYGVKVMSRTNTLGEAAETVAFDHYVVTFKNEDGSVIARKIVRPGEGVTPPEVSKEGHVLSGWTEDLNSVTSDLEVFPVFTPNKVTVIFIASDKILKTQSVDYGRLLTPPDIPWKRGHDKVDPVWSVTDFSAITEDLTVYAIYTLNTYTVTFRIGLEEFTYTVQHGAAITPPEIPPEEGYDQMPPTWSETGFDAVMKDIYAYPVYTINKYAVTFIGFDGEVLAVEMVEYTGTAEPPEAPKVSGYVFTGWDQELHNVTSDRTITALYEKKPSLFSCGNMISVNVFGVLLAGAYVCLRRLRKKDE